MLKALQIINEEITISTRKDPCWGEGEEKGAKNSGAGIFTKKFE